MVAPLQFIQARWYQKGSVDRDREVIVLHSMEADDKPGTAIGVGRFFAALPSTNKASAHVGCDFKERVRYVSDDDVAYAAPGMNARGLHLEQAGYARYTAGDWTQPQMMLMLQQAAAQLKEWSDEYKIPLKFIDAKALRDGKTKGVTTHAEVSKAFGKSDHWDPGPNFPINTLLAMANGGEAPQEDELPAYLHENDPSGDGYWLIKPTDGGVFAYSKDGKTSGDGVAPFFGSMAGKKMAAPIVDFEPYVVDGKVLGYYLLGSDGGVFAFGKAPFTDSYAGHVEWHKGARTFVGISQNDAGGYTLVAYEDGTDPPIVDSYDLTTKK